MKVILTGPQKRKKANGLCINAKCTNVHAPNQNYCHKHKMQNWRKKNPEAYRASYNKQNQKQINKKKLTK
jgi:hypothetical protein